MYKKTLGCVLGVVAINANAMPIPNNTVVLNKAGWYPSATTPCLGVCKEQGLIAEEENYVVPTLQNSKTYDCKVPVMISPVAASNQKGWIFGNNFNSPNYAPFCIATDIFGKTNRYGKFMCLCVRPE